MSLTIRPITVADTDGVHDIVSHWDVARQLGTWPWPADRDTTEWKVTKMAADPLARGGFQGDTLVGTVGFRDDVWGIMIHPSAHRRGHARAMAEACIPAYFATGADALLANVWEDNAPSHAFHASLGFREVSRDTRRQMARDEDVVNVIYRLTRDAWEART